MSGMKRLSVATGQAKIACEVTCMIRADLRKQADRASLIAYLKSYLK